MILPDNYSEDEVRVRVRIAYHWSDVKKFESMIQEWDRHIQINLNDYNDIIYYLEQFEKPFGFFESVVSGAAGKVLTPEDMEDLEKERSGDNRYAARERAIVGAFEGLSTGVAARLGYAEMPWLNLTWFMAGV